MNFVRPVMRETFYSNQYVQGSVLRPLLRTAGLTIGIILLTGLGAEIAAFAAASLMAVLFHSTPVNNTFWAVGLAFGGLGLWALISCWIQFAQIMRARTYVADGMPLDFVEGPAVFSRGRKARRRGYFPTRLGIGGKVFDLNTCARRWDLLTVGNYPFVHAENHPRGREVGMKVATPFRVWYAPSGVIVRAEIEMPEAYLDPQRRAAFLMHEFRDDPERVERIKRIEAAKQRQQASDPPPAEVQARIEKLKADLRKSGVRIPRD